MLPQVRDLVVPAELTTAVMAFAKHEDFNTLLAASKELSDRLVQLVVDSRKVLHDKMLAPEAESLLADAGGRCLLHYRLLGCINGSTGHRYGGPALLGFLRKRIKGGAS